MRSHPRERRSRRSTRLLVVCAASGGLLFLASGCDRDPAILRLAAIPSADAAQSAVSHPGAPEEINPRLLRRFAPIHGAATGPESAQVRLGRALYFEPLLSRDGRVSCNSCHPLSQYGTTATRFSTGVAGKIGRRNAPSVYNAVGHFRQFWDGRAATLMEQAFGPLSNPFEMGMTPAGIVQVLQAIPGYRELFASAFPGEKQPVTLAHVATAIAEFERGLITPSRWDRYLDGDRQALTADEKEGVKLFANLGCMVCHTGAYIGGTMFEKLGVFVPWPNQTDHGRREVTGNPADDMVFKVPSLRNVARTAPYFHDGSTRSLDTAVRMMARHQLGVDLTEDEARSIAAWLGSLTGEIPLDYTRPPELPAAPRR